MSYFIRLILLLSIVLASNLYLAKNITLENIDVEQFFPQKTIESVPPEALDYRYLFVHNEDKVLLTELENESLIEYFQAIPTKNNSYLVLFKEAQQEQLLSRLDDSEYMGTPILGSLLSNEFLNNISLYLLILIPLLIPLIIFLTSARYFLNLTLEVSLFSLFILTSIIILKISLNAAHLLSLLFVYIYTFTMMNQVYFNSISTNRLLISIGISLLTTWLSALLLSFSDFGVISDFGSSLMLWLFILTLYISIRMFVLKRTPMKLQWFSFQVKHFKTYQAWSFIMVMTVLASGLLLKPIEINLNPLNLSSNENLIANFEEKHVHTEPILISIKSKNCSLLEYKCNQKLHTIEQNIIKDFPIAATRVTDLDLAYNNFTQQNFSNSNLAGFSQFKLAMEMMDSDQFLYSTDYKTAYMMVSVSLLTSIQQLSTTKQLLLDLNHSQSDFDIQLLGRFNDVALYQSIFIDEMWIGIILIFALLASGIILYYKQFKPIISLMPALLTLVIFSAIHWWGDINFSIMSLIAVILFVGLIADNIIHILIAYKSVYQDCFKVALKPIILSNLIMIASLTLTLFLEKGFLKIFGLELALLLAVHLLLIIFLLPSLLKAHLPRPMSS